MPQQARIFCERAKPLVTITKEHLFSRRVDRILMPELPGPDKSFERTTAGPDGLATSKTWPTQVIAAIEATVVCGSSADGCNGGWMSDLDGQVRQLLEPMMLGKPRTLSPVYGTTSITSAASAAPHRPSYFVIYRSTRAPLSAGHRLRHSMMQALTDLRIRCSPLPGTETGLSRHPADRLPASGG